MASSIVVVDVISDIVSTISGVRFDYGHPLEMFNTLNAMSSGTAKAKKFPLIMLFAPFKEDGNKKAYERMVELNFILAVKTEQAIKSEERYTKNYRDYLIPLSDSLKAAIIASKQILTPYSDDFKFETQIHTEWGTQNKWGTSAIISNDFIDAIEVNTTLQFKEKRFTFLTKRP